LAKIVKWEEWGHIFRLTYFGNSLGSSFIMSIS